VKIFLDIIKKNNSKERLKQDWAGSLKDFKITAIELQKKALDWRLR
jgi:hypothetical protein